MRTRLPLMARLRWIVLALVSLSELAILQWALRAVGGPGLGWAGGPVALAGIAAFNVCWTLLARRSRRLRATFWFGRGYVMLSLGALASGVVLGSVFVGVHGLAVWWPELGTDRWLLLGGAGSLGGVVALLVYSLSFGQRRVAIESLSVAMPGLPRALDGLTIAHITDLHIGPNLRAPRLRRFVDRVNATGADLIAITGDIFDFDPAYIEEGCRELHKLWAPRGVIAVLGNHDVYTGADQVARGIAQLTSIRLLRDASVRLDIDGAPLHVVGIDDPGRGLSDRSIESAALERLAGEIPPGEPRLLLVHRPNYLPQIARLGFPLALAGHTHGGQVSLPRPAQHWNVARLMTPWTRGLFRLGNTALYVNRGLGVGGVAMRLNCPREIALVTLRSVH